MRYAATVLLSLIGASAAWAQSTDPNQLVQQDGDAPANWCRNGQFPSLSKDYQVGQIIEKSRLMKDDDSKVVDACPADDIRKCPAKGMIEAKTPVVISKKLRNFYCVYNARNDSSGWVPEKSLAITPAKEIKTADWIGIWSDGTNRIEIKQEKSALRVLGHASWSGGAGGSVNEGELDFVARASGNRLVLKAKDDGDCAAEVINLGAYVIARDNSACGGMNVNFNGVYRRK